MPRSTKLKDAVKEWQTGRERQRQDEIKRFPASGGSGWALVGSGAAGDCFSDSGLWYPKWTDPPLDQSGGFTIGDPPSGVFGTPPSAGNDLGIFVPEDGVYRFTATGTVTIHWAADPTYATVGVAFDNGTDYTVYGRQQILFRDPGVSTITSSAAQVTGFGPMTAAVPLVLHYDLDNADAGITSINNAGIVVLVERAG